jgi:ferric-dicitrate binding protein FerR (iron transport regulator)
MRRLTSFLAASCLVWGIGCEEGKKEGETGKEATPAAAPADKPAEGDKPAEAAADSADDPAAGQPAEVAAEVKDIGVEPGAFQYDKDEGGEAVLSAASGTVEVRRVGTETWEPGKADDELHPGDQVRAAEGASATVTLADETAIELAEESAVAVGSREATEDPSSTAAVLYGVARFTVAPRAEGEGPFLVYAVNGVIAAKGTVYSVGTAASGETRVGVEEGAVEVSGGAKLDAPVAVDAGKAVVIAPEGQPGAIEATGTVDFGTWRDEVEARVKAEEAAKFHADRAAKLEVELKQAYADLEAQSKAAEEAEARAKAAEEAQDAKQYEAAAPEIGASVDASFALSNRLQYLTYAMLADAYIADSLYVRHPTVVKVIDPVRPRLATAILWHKKYHFVTYAYLRPMRPWYYVHTPVGRARARFVAYTIPPWYARVNLRYQPIEWRARVRTPVFRLPVWKVKRGVRKTIFVEAPRVGWYAGVRARVRPARARVAWYVKPKAPKARIVIGMRPAVQVKTVFKVRPPRPRAEAVVRFGGRMRVGARGGARVGGGAAAGVKVKAAVDTPDVDVGGRVKAGVVVGGKVKAGVGGAAVEVRDRAGGAVKAGAGAVKASAGAVEAGVGKVKAGAAVGGGVDVKAGVGGRVKAGGGGGAGIAGGAGIGVKAGAGGRVKAGTPVEKNPGGGKGDGKDKKKKKKGKAGEGGAGGN